MLLCNNLQLRGDIIALDHVAQSNSSIAEVLHPEWPLALAILSIAYSQPWMTMKAPM